MALVVAGSFPCDNDLCGVYFLVRLPSDWGFAFLELEIGLVWEDGLLFIVSG